MSISYCDNPRPVLVSACARDLAAAVVLVVGGGGVDDAAAGADPAAFAAAGAEPAAFAVTVVVVAPVTVRGPASTDAVATDGLPAVAEAQSYTHKFHFRTHSFSPCSILLSM